MHEEPAGRAPGPSPRPKRTEGTAVRNPARNTRKRRAHRNRARRKSRHKLRQPKHRKRPPTTSHFSSRHGSQRPDRTIKRNFRVPPRSLSAMVNTVNGILFGNNYAAEPTHRVVRSGPGCLEKSNLCEVPSGEPRTTKYGNLVHSACAARVARRLIRPGVRVDVHYTCHTGTNKRVSW